MLILRIWTCQNCMQAHVCKNGLFNWNSKNTKKSVFIFLVFIENELFVPLNRPAVLLVALNIAAQITNHNLYTLNLESNQIYLGEGLVWIRRLFPELKILKLGDNKVMYFKFFLIIVSKLK